eukprot:Skav200577  [mRNA]  locus=scaffold917:284068:292925:+ [translate_table: standard]
MKLILNSTAIASTGFISPGHNCSILSHSSEGMTGSRDLTNIMKLILHIAAVATSRCITPCHHTAVTSHSCKRIK